MPTPDQINAARGALIRRQGLNQAGRIGLLMLGLGAGARGAGGLFELAKRNLRPSGRPAPGSPVMLDIPVRPHKPAEEEESTLGAPSLKLAQKQAGWLEGLLTGGGNTNPMGWWGTLPASAILGGAGAYAGWRGADALMDSRRKAQLKDELENAKQEYEQALAGTSKLGQALDALYDEVAPTIEKQALNATDFAGSTAGGLATLGLGSSLLSGLLAYNLAKKDDSSQLAEKARRRYELEQFQRKPSPIFARPVPVAPNASDEEEPQFVGKAAGLLLGTPPTPPPPPRQPTPPRFPSDTPAPTPEKPSR